MDWIERLFGFSPDGGDGSLEIAIAVVSFVISAALVATAFPELRAKVRRAISWRGRSA
jgi:hypothetical protein